MTTSEDARPVTPARRYAAGDLVAYATEILMVAGLRPVDAAIVAATLVRADLRGITTHGLVRLPLYVERILAGGIDPDATPVVVEERGATAVLDARGGIGHVAADRAMRRASELAAQHGLGAVGVRGSGHFGAADGYAMIALERDQIGFVTTNTPPALAPTGGLTAMLGTNPWALAVPAGFAEPIVMDFALTSVARGRIRQAAARGEEIPSSWALDREGRPTTDPQAALDGLLLPIGGHKGYGMALAVDILAGVLTGASFATAVQPPQQPERAQDVGHLFLAIDVAHFMPVEQFKARVDQLVGTMRSSTLAAGTERIYLPGEMEAERARDRARYGVPLDAALRAALDECGARLGIAMPAALAE